MPPFRLSELAHGAGCACKLGPAALGEALSRLVPPAAADLVVGLDTGDDALVWRWSEDRYLVATTDFFAPIVDDAELFGRIAATNAGSDIYAMGARPLFALNIVGWPAEQPLGVLGDILVGGQAAAVDGGWVVAGGHTIDSPEPFYGQAILCELAPAALLTNAGARPGEAVVLTKPLGIGAVTTAAKAEPEDGEIAQMLGRAVDQMVRSNAQASAVALEAQASACTDVTGFGLVGHLAKLAAASGCSIELDVGAIPQIPGVWELIQRGTIPGGTGRNRRWLGKRVVAANGLDETETWCNLLADPQTSGGLVFTCPKDRAQHSVDTLRGTGHDASVIGRTIDRTAADIILTPSRRS